MEFDITTAKIDAFLHQKCWFSGVCVRFLDAKNGHRDCNKRYMKPVRIIFAVVVCGFVSTVHADIASVQWVRSIINALEPPAAVQPDWDQTVTTADDYIKNKPTIPSTAADVGAVAATQSTLGGILTTNATTGAVEVSSTIAESKVANLTTDLAAKQNAQIGVAGDAGKAVIVANDGTMTISTNTLGSAAYTASTAYDASGTASGLVGTLSNLTTSDKTNVVAAINEVKSSISNINTGVASVTEGATNGTVAVDGTDVAVHGLGAAAYKGVAASIADNEQGLTTGDQVYDALANKVTANSAITGATKTKITYDAKGLVTSGADLDAADIPNLPSSKINALTGYTKGADATALAASDTLNAALSKLENQIDGKQASGSYVPTTTEVNGNALSSNVTLDGADIALTGYSKPNSTSAVAAADTVNAAIGKLEAALDGKQASGSYVQTTTTVNGHALSSDVSVTKSDVGLANVQNVDQTNASNLSSGTVNVARLPVGTTSTTVAAGDDGRFDSVSTTQPSGTPPTGRVWVWFN